MDNKKKFNVFLMGGKVTSQEFKEFMLGLDPETQLEHYLSIKEPELHEAVWQIIKDSVAKWYREMPIERQIECHLAYGILKFAKWFYAIYDIRHIQHMMLIPGQPDRGAPKWPADNLEILTKFIKTHGRNGNISLVQKILDLWAAEDGGRLALWAQKQNSLDQKIEASASLEAMSQLSGTSVDGVATWSVPKILYDAIVDQLIEHCSSICINEVKTLLQQAQGFAIRESLLERIVADTKRSALEVLEILSEEPQYHTNELSETIETPSVWQNFLPRLCVWFEGLTVKQQIHHFHKIVQGGEVYSKLWEILSASLESTKDISAEEKLTNLLLLAPMYRYSTLFGPGSPSFEKRLVILVDKIYRQLSKSKRAQWCSEMAQALKHISDNRRDAIKRILDEYIMELVSNSGLSLEKILDLLATLETQVRDSYYIAAAKEYYQKRGFEKKLLDKFKAMKSTERRAAYEKLDTFSKSLVIHIRFQPYRFSLEGVLKKHIALKEESEILACAFKSIIGDVFRLRLQDVGPKKQWGLLKKLEKIDYETFKELATTFLQKNVIPVDEQEAMLSDSDTETWIKEKLLPIFLENISDDPERKEKLFDVLENKKLKQLVAAELV